MDDVLNLEQVMALCDDEVKGVLRHPAWRSPKPGEVAKALLDLYGKADKIGLAWALCPRHLVAIESKGMLVHTVIFRWHPETTAVQLRGGSRDGHVLDVHGAPNATVRIAEMNSDFRSFAANGDPDDEMRELVTETVDWEMCGWSPKNSTWIYERKETQHG